MQNGDLPSSLNVIVGAIAVSGIVFAAFIVLAFAVGLVSLSHH